MCPWSQEPVDREMKVFLKLLSGTRGCSSRRKAVVQTCKASWKKVYDAEAAKRAAINDHNTRRYCRQCTKYTHIKSQFERICGKTSHPHSVVEDLLSQELLSDEASGPEDDDQDETFDAWKDSVQNHHRKRQRGCSHQVHSRANFYTPQIIVYPIYLAMDFGISSQWLEEHATTPSCLTGVRMVTPPDAIGRKFVLFVLMQPEKSRGFAF
ncbi:hypothetical protein B0H14DRAFT_2607891 [Mycena olivaceomarginata]|nr:hypothetical protein B0H14DRAFT_2607891 [Mycena olivaceomarginata]